MNPGRSWNRAARISMVIGTLKSIALAIYQRQPLTETGPTYLLYLPSNSIRTASSFHFDSLPLGRAFDLSTDFIISSWGFVIGVREHFNFNCRFEQCLQQLSFFFLTKHKFISLSDVDPSTWFSPLSLRFEEPLREPECLSTFGSGEKLLIVDSCECDWVGWSTFFCLHLFWLQVGFHPNLIDNLWAYSTAAHWTESKCWSSFPNLSSGYLTT